MFRFTIRDVLWLTVGMGAGWWANRNAMYRLVREERADHRKTVIQLEREKFLRDRESGFRWAKKASPDKN